MPSNNPTPAVQKWEYLALTRKSETYLLNDLNVCGQEGWEVVSTTYYKDMKGAMVWTAFLKRPAIGLPPTNLTAGAGSVSASKPAAEGGSALQGFDLSGDEFEIKG